MDLSSLLIDGFHGKTFITGGQNDMRTELLYFGVSNSRNCPPTVILHKSNAMLENRFRGTNAIVVDDANPCFDPFYLRNNTEIVDLIISSAPEQYQLGSCASDYIDGMLQFLDSKKIRPTIAIMESCPHSELVEIINKQVLCRKLDVQVARKIIMKLNAGVNERGRIERYFHALKKECENIQYNGTGQCYDIEYAIAHGQTVLLDMGQAPILLNLFFYQIQELIRKFPELTVVVDNISLQVQDRLVRTFLETTSCKLVVSGDDSFAVLGSDEKLLNTLFENGTDRFILSQQSGVSASKISEHMGVYKKKEITESVHDVRFSLTEPMPLGIPNDHIIAEKDVPRVTVDELQKLPSDELFWSTGNKCTHCKIKTCV